MARYLVTGVAGFIASRVAEMLLDDGHTVHGVDNMNDAYDVRMKEYRLGRLEGRSGFSFDKLDIADSQAVNEMAEKVEIFDAVINLAARAGVRKSVENPWLYVETNEIGTSWNFAASGISRNLSWHPPPASTADMRPYQPPKMRRVANPCSLMQRVKKPQRS
jgi:UDP-glucose 4-epimerase